jgi:hypothetical protein
LIDTHRVSSSDVSRPASGKTPPAAFEISDGCPGCPYEDLAAEASTEVRLGPALLRSAVRHWIGYLDGTPVAAAASHAAHGVVNLCLAATLPAARRHGVWRTLVAARCAGAPDLPAVAFTSDYSRPGFLRTGFLPITRFTLWAVAA